VDRIDATGLRQGKSPQPNDEELNRLWKELAGDDDARCYPAFWTLVAASKHAAPCLRRKLAPMPNEANGEQISATSLHPKSANRTGACGAPRENR
jgi:hypothetical protein